MDLYTKTIATQGEVEYIEQDGQTTYRMVVSGHADHKGEEQPQYFNLILNHNPKSPYPEKPQGDISYKKLKGVKVTVSLDVTDAAEVFSTKIPQ